MDPNENQNNQNTPQNQQESTANHSAPQSTAEDTPAQHYAQPSPVTVENIQQAQPSHHPEQMPQKGVNAGLITLQWLTYAFWGWTILALSMLTVSVISNFVDKNSSGDSGFTPYGIAAVLVLLPISFICDAFYAPREPAKKSGVETLVMVVHAVIFALFGIGSLIAAVIAGVMLLTSTGSTNQGVSTTIFSALIITIYYAITFIRTLNIQKIITFSKYYRFIMLLTVGIIALLGLIGPVAKERATRNDRLISSNIPSIVTEVNDYVATNKKLPSNLNELKNLNEDSKKIIDGNLVSFKPEGVYISTDKAINGLSQSEGRRYQLCTTYTKKVSNSYSSNDTHDEYQEYVDTSSHPSGNVCYKLKTYAY
jgi:uncharacterized membrane protein YqjE